MEHLLLRRCVESSKHCTHARNKTKTNNSPRAGGHQTIRPSIRVQSPSSNTDNTNTKTSVHKRFIQVASLVDRHAAILTSLPVEDEVRGHHSSTHNRSTVRKSLPYVTLGGTVRRLHVCPFESILECLTGSREDGRRNKAEGLLSLRLKGRVVDESSVVRGFRNLAQRRWNGEGAPEEERHDCRI